MAPKAVTSKGKEVYKPPTKRALPFDNPKKKKEKKGKGKGNGGSSKESPPPSELSESEEEELESGEEGSDFHPDESDLGDDDDDEHDDDDDDVLEDDEDEIHARDEPEREPTDALAESAALGQYSEKQLLVQVLRVMEKMCDKIGQITTPPSAIELTKKVVAKVSASSAFKLSPRKKSLGVHRKKALKVVLKIVWREIAKVSTSIPMYMIVGAVMEVLDVTMGSEYEGSISAAFTSQLKTCLAALLRESRSYVVGAGFETVLQVNDLPPRVEAKYIEMAAARMAVHDREFRKLLDAPPPYDLADHPHYHGFCAYIKDGEAWVFGEKWDAIVTQFLLRLPPGSRKLSLWNLSFLFGSIVARLTFVEKDGVMMYGKLDEKVWTQAKFEGIQRWLMNPDECRTMWAPLLKIRRENANYRIGHHDGDSPALMARAQATTSPQLPLRATPTRPLFSRTPSPVRSV